jgi:fatty acid desaturase (delta-4 desaturase)
MWKLANQQKQREHCNSSANQFSFSQHSYKFDTPFEQEIKREVFKIVRRGKEFGTYGWFARCFFYVGLFFGLQYLWVFSGSTFALAIAYGISQALIGLNVQHDANHGAASKTPWINDVLGLGADFIGGSKWLWMEQHWTHHAYTNHAVKDPDSFGAEPFMLFNDYPLGDKRRTWAHNFQAFFYMFVLAGYWLSSVFNPEIFDLRQRGALGVGFQMDSDYVKDRRKWAIGLRILYIYVNVVVPFQQHDFMTAFAHVMVMGIASSLNLAVLFSLSHNFENVDRDPSKDAREKGEAVCWFKSQVETSCTYGGFTSGCLTGGLNFQVEHHLFPRMSSAWYPYIAPKVREICKKHGVRYVYYPWIWQNWFSTIKYLHAAGTGSNWAEGNPLRGNL